MLGQLIGNTDALGTWYFPQTAMLFAFMGILVGIIYGLKEDKIISSFMNGAADLLSVALIVAVARWYPSHHERRYDHCDNSSLG